jgi:hypothetical protein
MLGVCLKARLQRVWPTDPLKPGRDRLIIQIRVITAVAADDLEQAGAVTFAVRRDPGRLAPQAGCPAMSGLASRRERPRRVDAGPRPRRIMQHAGCGDGTQTRRRCGARLDIWLFGATHFGPRLISAPAAQVALLPGLGQHYPLGTTILAGFYAVAQVSWTDCLRDNAERPLLFGYPTWPRLPAIRLRFTYY